MPTPSRYSTAAAQRLRLKKFAVPNTSNVLAVGGPGGKRTLASSRPRSAAVIWASQYACVTSGSCYFDVRDVEALRQELLDAGARPGPIAVQEHGGQCLRLFFLKEDHDGYCFCFGQPLRKIRDILSP